MGFESLKSLDSLGHSVDLFLELVSLKWGLSEEDWGGNLAKVQSKASWSKVSDLERHNMVDSSSLSGFTWEEAILMRS